MCRQLSTKKCFLVKKAWHFRIFPWLSSLVLLTGVAASPYSIYAQTIDDDRKNCTQPSLFKPNTSILTISPPESPSTSITTKGSQMSINGRTLPLAWSSWQTGEKEAPQTRIGISDTGARRFLGVELLSSPNPNFQPINWFPTGDQQPGVLAARRSGNYRYLDITDLAEQAGWKLEIVDNTLQLNASPSRINYICRESKDKGERITIFLDKPTFWEMEKPGVLNLYALANPQLLTTFAPPVGEEAESEAPSFQLQGDDFHTQIKLDNPTGQNLNVSSQANPARLVIDVPPTVSFRSQDIRWAESIRWREQLVNLDDRNFFPVTWLEVDLTLPEVSLRPIWPDSEKMQGISPLVNTARESQSAAAINAGFFNRDNKLPLGAIRSDGTWFSGPILNRGAIAWDNQGRVKISRLSLQETLTTSGGKSFPVLHLNSAYLKAGISRYTSAWGKSYITLTDNEIIVLVKNDQVISQFTAEKAGKQAFAIPEDGYLLALRSYRTAASALEVGTRLSLTNTTSPSDLAQYPHIVGAGPLLVSQGQVVLDGESEQFSAAFNRQGASRSAVGVTPEGKLILVAVHERLDGKGPTLSEMAQLMQRLGATNALNLDGGSSTSLYLGGQLIDRLPSTAARVHNGLGIFLEVNSQE